VDQFYEAHPDRFLEPSCYSRIDGWEDEPARRIDYVFKRSADPMRIQAMDVLFDGSFHPVVSDHFGYVARFALF
jgi:maltose 6'-phosphate phosphatase